MSFTLDVSLQYMIKKEKKGIGQEEEKENAGYELKCDDDEVSWALHDGLQLHAG